MKPITLEYIRRFSVLIFLAFFAWMFFYTPSDIYTIQFQNYKEMYNIKRSRGIVNSDISLEKYINRAMQAPIWRSSSNKISIYQCSGDVRNFLERLLPKIRKVSVNNNYFFRGNELPKSFKVDESLRKADYLSLVDKYGEKKYFQLYLPKSNISFRNIPLSIHYPYRKYSYLLILLSLLSYFFIPKTKIPKGAAYYTRFNAVYLADVLSFSFWIAGWMFFFLPDESSPLFVRYFLLLFFGIFALAIVFPTVKYASNWYLFTEDSFQWSNEDGIGKISLSNIISVKLYKKQLPRWVAPLLIIFGKGQLIATGAGMISMSSSPEKGVEITTKFGKKIKIMTNYLEADKLFYQYLQMLEHKK